MGFTRYYNIVGSIDPQKFEKYSEDCKIICEEITKETGHGLAGCDGEGDPEFTTDEIRFNGIEDDSHETFALGKRSNGFKFTKTTRNPYDRHVLACLIMAKKYFGDAIKVSSDGDNEDLKVEKMILQFSRVGKINLILEN